MHKHLSVLALLLIAAACSTPSTVQPLAVPLQYKTMAPPAEFPSLQSCSAVSRVVVTDARDNKDLGKRYVEGKSAAVAAVTTTSDVAAWVQSGAEAALKKSGVTIGNASAPELRISIDQIVTNENVLHRSGYDGRIALGGQLGSCWKQSVEGTAENYGYAGSAENYQEMLNHALDRAVLRMINDKDFKKGLCGCS
jgi:uncharacterized lipoprotein YajG